jgi:hypothetical protein
MLWHYWKQTSGHISTRILEHIRDSRLHNQESLIGEHSTKNNSDKITIHIMGSISPGKPLKYSPNFNREVGYGSAEKMFASSFPLDFLLNHSAHPHYVALYSILPTSLALQDLYVGLLTDCSGRWWLCCIMKHRKTWHG